MSKTCWCLYTTRKFVRRARSVDDRTSLRSAYGAVILRLQRRAPLCGIQCRRSPQAPPKLQTAAHSLARMLELQMLRRCATTSIQYSPHTASELLPKTLELMKKTFLNEIFSRGENCRCPKFLQKESRMGLLTSARLHFHGAICDGSRLHGRRALLAALRGFVALRFVGYLAVRHRHLGTKLVLAIVHRPAIMCRIRSKSGSTKRCG